jgi:hypothetical protein
MLLALYASIVASNVMIYILVKTSSGSEVVGLWRLGFVMTFPLGWSDSVFSVLRQRVEALIEDENLAYFCLFTLINSLQWLPAIGTTYLIESRRSGR